VIKYYNIKRLDLKVKKMEKSKKVCSPDLSKIFLAAFHSGLLLSHQSEIEQGRFDYPSLYISGFPKTVKNYRKTGSRVVLYFVPKANM